MTATSSNRDEIVADVVRQLGEFPEPQPGQVDPFGVTQPTPQQESTTNKLPSVSYYYRPFSNYATIETDTIWQKFGRPAGTLYVRLNDRVFSNEEYGSADNFPLGLAERVTRRQAEHAFGRRYVDYERRSLLYLMGFIKRPPTFW